ncbi:membrane protein insertion efficiency factor YidD [Dehalococcoidia bacterium]|nr:membrane protein insertion efficiency factor YidD [Dehalococcoidia bacterium]
MYRKGISPFIPGVCRHMPTCSVYSIEAVEKYGPWRGTYVAARRLIRCTPLGTRGYDPVP